MRRFSRLVSNRALRLEWLEDRLLLSVAVLHPVPVAPEMRPERTPAELSLSVTQTPAGSHADSESDAEEDSDSEATEYEDKHQPADMPQHASQNAPQMSGLFGDGNYDKSYRSENAADAYSPQVIAALPSTNFAATADGVQLVQTAARHPGAVSAATVMTAAVQTTAVLPGRPREPAEEPRRLPAPAEDTLIEPESVAPLLLPAEVLPIPELDLLDEAPAVQEETPPTLAAVMGRVIAGRLLVDLSALRAQADSLFARLDELAVELGQSGSFGWELQALTAAATTLAALEVARRRRKRAVGCSEPELAILLPDVNS
jgi:hypothetical protein